MSAIRRTGATSIATLFGVAIMMTGAFCIAPDWARRVGLDVWNLSEEHANTNRAMTEQSRLAVKEEQLKRQIEVADHTADRVMTGALSLAAATDELEPLLHSRDGFEISMRCANPEVRTYRQAVARLLLDRVIRAAKSNPPQSAACLARVNAEYRAMY